MLVVSYTTVSPLPTEVGGLISVALSRGSLRVGVTHHCTLRSPDFPQLFQAAIAQPTHLFSANPMTHKGALPNRHDMSKVRNAQGASRTLCARHVVIDGLVPGLMQ